MLVHKNCPQIPLCGERIWLVLAMYYIYVYWTQQCEWHQYSDHVQWCWFSLVISKHDEITTKINLAKKYSPLGLLNSQRCLIQCLVGDGHSHQPLTWVMYMGINAFLVIDMTNSMSTSLVIVSFASARWSNTAPSPYCLFHIISSM